MTRVAQQQDRHFRTPYQPAVRTRGPIRTIWRAARSVLFWSHLAVGVVVGLGVLVMSATGTVLAFQRQILEWSAAREHVVSPVAARIPLDSVVARARAAIPADQPLGAITVKRDTAAPVTIGLSARRYAYADPATGALVPASTAVQTFFFEAERLHRSMAIGEGLRGRPGATLMGAANLGFLFLVVTGVVLWLPRQLSRRAFRAVALFERRARGRRRDWNWHHVLGIWTAPVLFTLVLTGVFISYEWPTTLLQRAYGEKPVAARAEGSRGVTRASATAAGGARPETPAITVSLDSVVARAAAQVPDWYSISLRLPREAGAPLTATVSTTSWVRPDARTSLSFDTETGTMKVERGYAEQSRARQLRSWVRGLHTGEALGPMGQLVAAIACMAAVLLVWTGTALAWRRFLRAVA